MSKIEYPKMIYKGEGTADYIIVKDKEEHLIKQREGYHQHDGTLIEDSESPNEDVKEEEAENMPEETEDETKFDCNMCDFSGKNVRSLRFHKFKKHGIAS